MKTADGEPKIARSQSLERRDVNNFLENAEGANESSAMLRKMSDTNSTSEVKKKF